MKPFFIYTILILIAILYANQYAGALPPLGLTHVTPRPEGELEIIDGSAYISAGPSIYRVDLGGTVTVIELEHPEGGTPVSLTRAVKGPDGEVYVGANLNPPVPPFFIGTAPAAALFRLDEANEPIVTWERDVEAGQRLRLLGVDAGLRGVGNSDTILEPVFSATEFHFDGTVTELERPVGACCAEVTDVSASGHALGAAHIPGTLGSGVALWTPDGSFSFISTAGAPDSLRDRLDGQGLNIGYNFGDPAVINYGSQGDFEIHDDAYHAIVSHSDFALIEDPSFVSPNTYTAFFPGIVPADPNQAVDLFDVFRQLEGVNFHVITDLAAVEGRIYMTLSGPDGLFLFGARDPSVIPEPSTLVVLAVAVCAMGFCVWRRRVRLSNCTASAMIQTQQ